jgi:signal transduction histidine kinase/CheY-like chemotaxis protein
MMNGRQRIVRIRRQYNQWVANETLEDYALRFTAKSARRWSAFQVANTALGAISFLACEAIGATITLTSGFDNAVAATIAVSLLIFVTSLPIAYHAVKSGVDIDLLTRGAGFGYIGSTITSLVYASFTFIFFAIEAAIMSTAMEMCFGIPLSIGYLGCSLIIIPIVTHGIKMISRLQLWTQPIWLVLQCLPLIVIAIGSGHSVRAWTHFNGLAGEAANGFNIVLFGAASSVVLSLIAQIGEQVDFLRFLPPPQPGRRLGWWVAMISAGPGWILLGAAKIIAGSFLVVLALGHYLPPSKAIEPTEFYRIAFQYVSNSPRVALLLVGTFVVLSQIKINVTNSYAGSIAWSNFFARLTHSHPGRAVWVVFNVALALILMEMGVLGAIDRILGLYSNFAVAWIGALVADLVINKPLKLSPSYTEFRRAHLYAVNPVGVGAMAISLATSTLAFFGSFGSTAQALAPFLGLIAAFTASPVIAIATKGKYYIARPRKVDWSNQSKVQCCICEHEFEPEDMSHCPVYAGPICSLCCTLDARCHDSCKEGGGLTEQLLRQLRRILPKRLAPTVTPRLGHFLGVLLLCALMIGITLMLVGFQFNGAAAAVREAISRALTTVFFALLMISGVLAWILVLAQESRHVAEEESARQTAILMEEIEAHKRSDAKLQKAKAAAESANLAKSRYVVSISHEIRAPLNSIFGYAQLLERSMPAPSRHMDAVRVVRRSAQHLAHLIDGLLDVSKIEAGRLQLYRDKVKLGELLEQIVDMFRLPAASKNINLHYIPPDGLPPLVYADQSRLSQILINLLSNAIKYTQRGQVSLRVRYQNPIAVFDIEDSGIGIHQDDLEKIFEPFERGRMQYAQAMPGVGLGLTTTKLLTEIMGGEISVTSMVDRGSTFRVKLSLFEPPIQSETPTAPEQRIRGYDGRRIKVLVADDDQNHIGMMRELLTPLGFVLHFAADGASCIDRFEECRPDLVLLDISMPVLDGWEVLRRLREVDNNRTVVIIISANAGEFVTPDAEDSPHDGFLLKPIDVHRLLERIKALLHLDWVYDNEKKYPSTIAAGMPIIERLRVDDMLDNASMQSLRIPDRLPARHHLDALAELARIGHIDAVNEKLREIEREDHRFSAFVERLRYLTDRFEVRQLMSTLEELRHDA